MGHKILVVDDFGEFRELLADILRRRGYQVSCATNGFDAIELCDRERPDLLIAELDLPEYDGNDLCRQIRASFSVPVLALTARSLGQRSKALEAGACAVLPKPFELTVFMDLVGSLVQANRKPLVASPVLGFHDLDRG